MADDRGSITPEMIIDELVDRLPRVVDAFLRRGMHCVGCPIARFETIAEACRIYRQPLEPFLDDIKRAMERRTV